MNIYDIAKEAGVSISTVSRVMNHKGNVNPETRKKVEEILEKNNYTPSAIARVDTRFLCATRAGSWKRRSSICGQHGRKRRMESYW